MKLTDKLAWLLLLLLFIFGMSKGYDVASIIGGLGMIIHVIYINLLSAIRGKS